MTDTRTKFADLAEYSVDSATFDEAKVLREMTLLFELRRHRLDEVQRLPKHRLGDAFRRIRELQMMLDICFERYVTILEERLNTK